MWVWVCRGKHGVWRQTVHMPESCCRRPITAASCCCACVGALRRVDLLQICCSSATSYLVLRYVMCITLIMIMQLWICTFCLFLPRLATKWLQSTPRYAVGLHVASNLDCTSDASLLYVVFGCAVYKTRIITQHSSSRYRYPSNVIVKKDKPYTSCSADSSHSTCPSVYSWLPNAQLCVAGGYRHNVQAFGGTHDTYIALLCVLQ